MSATDTPLIDLLRSVPHDARATYEHHEFASSNFDYGQLCAQAAIRIAALEYALKKAEDATRQERTLHMNFVLDLHRVVQGEAPICHFEEIAEVCEALWADPEPAADAAIR